MQALNERFEMRLDQETLQAVESWRARQPDMPSRAEAIRRLIMNGLPDAKTELQISPGVTLMLHMMCEIFKHLKIKSDYDTVFIQRALYGGHLWALEWEMPGTFRQGVDSPTWVHEVAEILDMWDLIELSYEKLSSKEKATFANDAPPFVSNPQFRGFDGNNESNYMGIARFFIEDMGRFARFKGREMNSHMPSLEAYRRMLRVFSPMRNSTSMGGHLSAAQMVAVLNEMIHPENRAKAASIKVTKGVKKATKH